MHQRRSGGATSVLNTSGSMASTGLSGPGVSMAKDFLSVLDLSASEVARLLDIARQMKADRGLGRQAPTAHALAGRHVPKTFDKPTLRTRSACEHAAPDQ